MSIHNSYAAHSTPSELAPFQLIELHFGPRHQGRIAGYRIGEDQSAGVRAFSHPPGLAEPSPTLPRASAVKGLRWPLPSWSHPPSQRVDGFDTLSNSVSFANCRERGRRASDVWRSRFAWPHKWLRNEPNKTEHGPTTGRSIYYGSGHL